MKKPISNHALRPHDSISQPSSPKTKKLSTTTFLNQKYANFQIQSVLIFLPLNDIFWISILNECARSLFLTKMYMRVWYVGSISKEEDVKLMLISTHLRTYITCSSISMIKESTVFLITTRLKIPPSMISK